MIPMTQDQYDQTRGPGYVVRDEAVPDNEAEAANDQSKPMTRFQKVDSALLGDKTGQDETEQAAGDQMAMNQRDSGPPEADQASATDMTAPAGGRTGTGTGTRPGDY